MRSWLIVLALVGCTNNGTTNTCGNGKLDTGETCDPKDTTNACPAACDDGNACTADDLTGAASACTAACTHTAISVCTAGDGCCPAGCNHATDDDCSATCGNGIVDSGETCDGTNCPTDCNDGNACTNDTLTGSASNCSASCSHQTITMCQAGDGCCPAGCTHNNDTDCSASCGNSTVESGETCDGANCPTDCNDGNACTTDTLTGSAASCSAACSHTSVSQCMNGDGCCPAGCNSSNDNNCSASCGNGIIEAKETCDGVNCPATCNDGNACTKDTLTGSALNCSAACSFQTITACMTGDGCCPAGCTNGNDKDCSATCGNGTLEVGETCDGNCPSSCNDGAACTKDSVTGSSMNCSAVCSFQAITTCVGGDGCCPAGCTNANDMDCSAFCGDRIIEAGETCDGNCPSDCNDANACTLDKLLGSAVNCSAQCSHTVITQCTSGDGCCPPGCNHASDSDCSASCGNNTIEAGETCDGNCPTTCADSDACTIDTLIGSAANCSARCPSPHPTIVQCVGGDGCCPSGCNHDIDSDCLGVTPVAGPCAQGSDCVTGACFLEALTGYNGGYCTDSCNNMTSGACGTGNHCGGVDVDGNGFCLKDCTVPGDCRAHQSCYDVDGDVTKECFSIADGAGAPGAPCTHDQDCAGGTTGMCLVEQGFGFKNGYCTTFCNPSPSPSPSPDPFRCANGSQCSPNGALSNANTCWSNCNSQPECRGGVPGSGYECFDIGGPAGACVPAANGVGAIGAPCTGYWDCAGDLLGACLGFTNGYCTMFCETLPTCTGNQTCCPSGATCVDNAANTTAALCEKNCNTVADCRAADGFQCVVPPNVTSKECIQ